MQSKYTILLMCLKRSTPLLIVLCIFLTACSIKEHYELLKFFFDDVPNPDMMASEDGKPFANKGYLYQHKPAQDGACEECHSSTRSLILTKKDSDLCLKCHEGIPEEHNYMHGPVIAVACLLCHDPHSSNYPNLLREATPPLCRQCHTEQLMRKPVLPEHADINQDCLDCHFGHGGDSRYFLRSNTN